MTEYKFLLVLLFMSISWFGIGITQDGGRDGGGGGPSGRYTRHSTRPLCTVMKKTYTGLQTGSFITKDPGHWRYLKDGSMRYEVSTCTLKRFSQAEARQCLGGHHLLLIGDSLQRYQYLSLAYFIEHGVWPARFTAREKKDCAHINERGVATCGEITKPSIASENDWGILYGHSVNNSWRMMHQCIGGPCFNGKMDCQCARDTGPTSTENMFYQDRVNSTSDKILKLSFLSNLGDTHMHGWNRSKCEETQSCNLVKSNKNWDYLQNLAKKHSWDYEYHIIDYLEKVVPEILPDVDIAVYNSALWNAGFQKEEKISPIFKNLFKLVNKNMVPMRDSPPGTRGRCFWKGPSPAFSISGFGHVSPDKFESGDDEARNAAFTNGCGVFDVTHVTKQWSNFHWNGDEGRQGCCGGQDMFNVYFDAAHFQPWVNEELNQILLNILC